MDETTAQKECSKCGEVKPLTGFYARGRGNPALHSECKSCFSARSRAKYLADPAAGKARAAAWALKNPEKAREASRLRAERNRGRERARRRYLERHGLTLQQWTQMFDAQDGRCAICKREASELSKVLSVDHDHVTGKIRALLCHHCNCAIGWAREDTAVLLAAVDYLVEHGSPGILIRVA